MKFQGLYTAIVTPFAGNRVDEEAFRMLVEAQIAAGVAGIVAVGTTGESPTLTVKEHLRVIELAVESAAGRIQVIAGTGANSTAEAIHMTQEAEKMGVDGTLQVCPYYNKPSQDGVYAHFKAIADATRLPIMLYSIPGRCGIEISVETISRLAKDCSHIVCVKEAGGNVDRVNQLMQVVPENFTVLCGDDGLTVPFMACGASGLVSVTSNLVPGIMNSIVKAGYGRNAFPPEDFLSVDERANDFGFQSCADQGGFGDERRYTARSTPSAGSIAGRKGSSAFRTSSTFQHSLIF